jgi:hypothetical protein
MTKEDYNRIEEMFSLYHHSPSAQGVLCKGRPLCDCPSETCSDNYKLLQRLLPEVKQEQANVASKLAFNELLEREHSR